MCRQPQNVGDIDETTRFLCFDSAGVKVSSCRHAAANEQIDAKPMAVNIQICMRLRLECHFDVESINSKHKNEMWLRVSESTIACLFAQSYQKRTQIISKAGVLMSKQPQYLMVF